MKPLELVLEIQICVKDINRFINIWNQYHDQGQRFVRRNPFQIGYISTNKTLDHYIYFNPKYFNSKLKSMAHLLRAEFFDYYNPNDTHITQYENNYGKFYFSFLDN